MSIFERHHKYDPLRRVLESVHSSLAEAVENEIRGDGIFCSEWGMTITPRIEQSDEHIAVVGFNISDPDFDEPLYECCAATGKDIDTAIGSCVGSFLFAFMNGIIQMKNGENGKPVTSTFNGKSHTWKVYGSDLVGMGENIDIDNSETVALKYWDMLKKEIVKRLGDRKMCYVKIFASKAIGKNDQQVTGEVRVNDIPSAELGAIVEKHAAQWNVEQFASQKQFFFIKQDVQPQKLYSGLDGRKVLISKVKRAIELFNEVKSSEDLQALPQTLTAEFGDVTLAWECFLFIPEICAENALSEATFPETVQIKSEDGEPISVYRSQLYDYYPICSSVFTLFSNGVFGEKTDEVFRRLVSNSATFNCISQAIDKGSKLSDLAMTALIFNVGKDFEIR